MEIEENISALEKFMNNIYFGESLAKEDSIKNLEDSLVEIKFKDTNVHRANGLLIIDNGYLLTAKHCTKNPKNNLLVYKNNVYGMERICVSDNVKDVSLIKMDLRKPPKAKEFKISKTNELLPEYYFTEPVNSKSIWYGKIENKFGFLRYKLKKVENESSSENMWVTTELIPGDSGGITIGKKGELMGINIGIATGNLPKSLFSEKISEIENIYFGLNLIQKEINRLKSHPFLKLKRYFIK